MAPIDVFDLAAKISLDTSGYENGLDGASEKTSTFGQKLKNGLSTAAKVGTAAITAVTTASVALGKTIVSKTSDIASYGDNIDKMSQKMGLSAEAYQEWDAIMQHSGTSIDALQSGMKTLANAVENGNDAFERLGITQEDIASMNNEQLFSATISALQNVENETERTYLAGQLLGRGATELGALLNTSAEETEAMRQQVHELGGVMSDESVKAAAKYQDTLQDMKTAISGVSRGLMSEFLPGITSVMDGITKLAIGSDEASETLEEGFGFIAEALENSIVRVGEIAQTIIPIIVDTVTKLLPLLSELAFTLLDSLGTAIAENLPTLADAALQVITMLGKFLIENLPLLIDAALQIIVSLGEGLAQALPELIPAVVDVILELVNTLISNVDMLVDVAIQIILALADGLIAAVPVLLEKAPEIVMQLVTALLNIAPKLATVGAQLLLKLATGIITNLPKLLTLGPKIIGTVVSAITRKMSEVLNIGKNIVSGIWKGISEKIKWLTDKVTGFFSGILGGVKSFLGIHSPSTVFAGIGKNMALGLGNGWDDEYASVKKDIEDGLDFDVAEIDATANAMKNISIRSNSGVSSFSSASANTAQPIIITVQSVLDGKVIGESSYRYTIDREKAWGTA